MLRRTFWLALALAAGLLLAKWISGPLQGWLDVMPVKLGETKLNIGGIQLAIFIMYLPVLYVLWQFRTKDTQKNLDKAQENLNANLLGLYLKMLLSENLQERCVGLIRLAALKQQGVFVKEIDSATRRSLNLEGAQLQGEDLSGVDLQGAILAEANLEGTILSKANLRHAKMQGVILIKVKLQGAILAEANLEGANMRGVILSDAYLQKTNLESADVRDVDFRHVKGFKEAILTNAKYDDKLAKFPDNFSPIRDGNMDLAPADGNGN